MRPTLKSLPEPVQQLRGAPAGPLLMSADGSSVGDRGAIMLNDGQRQFALRVQQENDHTKVILMLTGP